MSTSIASGSDTLLTPPHSQSNPPVELNESFRGTPRALDRIATTGVDTVKLSVSAQVRQLVQQGQTANQIADALGLTASLVNSYLYVPLSSVGGSASTQSLVTDVSL